MHQVLVVDEDPAALAFLRERPTANKVTMQFAHTGREAIKWLRCASFEVIVVNVHLPDMPGWELAAHAHGICPEVPVIAVSADDSWTCARRMRIDGGPIFFYGLKPLNESEMCEAVQAALTWYGRQTPRVRERT